MNTFDAYKSRPSADGLQRLLSSHQDAVYNVCWQVLRQDQDAQDAAQQVLLNLVDDLPKIADAEHFRRWLYRASFQVALDVRKMRRRRMNHEQKARPAAPPDETIELVHEHVAALDDDLRALVAEHYFERKPLESLAVSRGCSTTAVWKKLERAKEKLRDSISRAGFASLLPSLDAVLTSVKPVRAPKGLLPAGVATHVAAAGGLALKMKLMAATALVLTGIMAYGVIRRREERAGRTALEVAAARRTVPAKVPITSPVAAATTPPDPAPVEMLDAETFFLALQKAMAIPDRDARWKEYRRIGIRLQDEDFQRAESKIRVKHGTRDYYHAALGSILNAWLAADGKRVLDLFRTLPPQPGQSKAEGTRILLMNFAHFHPDAVLAYAKQLPEEEGRTELVALLTPMTAAGAREAAVRADQLPPGEERTQALGKAVSAWANSDFQAAATWAETVLPREERKQVLWAALEAMGGRQNSPAAAEVCLKIFEGKDLYNMAVEQVVKNWCETDPAAAAAFVLRLPVVESKAYPSNPRTPLSTTVGMKWALVDPSAALIWAQQLPEGEERRETLQAVAGAWVKSVLTDPTQALGLVQTLPEKERRPAMEVIVAAWAELDPRAAAAVALSFPGGPVGTDAVARAWAAGDPEGARAWANTLPAEHRESALKAIDSLRK